MPNIDINASRLGWNIKCLREAYGETLSDLMNAIGANSTGPISYYESGKQIPSRDTLLRIAKHYKVTVNELLYGDFSNLSSISMADLKINDGYLILEYILPIVTSPEANENKSFLLAHKLHSYLCLLLRKGESFSSKLSAQCVNFYKKAESDGIPEATANLLWWLFVEGITILGVSPGMIARNNATSVESMSVCDAIKSYYLWKIEDAEDDDAKNIEEAKESYIKEIDSEYTQLLKKLNQYPDYADLAAYYSALRYYFGLVDSGLTFEMNTAVGRQMLISLAKLENKYAAVFSGDANAQV